jgi:hypothetical protein
MSDPTIERLGDRLRDAAIMADGEAVEAYCLLSEALCDYLPADVLSRVMREVADAGAEDRTRVQHVLDRQRAVARVDAEQQARAERIARGQSWTAPPMMVGGWPSGVSSRQVAAITAMVPVYADPSTPCDGLYSWSVEAVDLDEMREYGPVPPSYVGAVEVRWTYVQEGEADEVDPMTGAGLGAEVTIYGLDGEVLTSQDLG